MARDPAPLSWGLLLKNRLDDSSKVSANSFRLPCAGGVRVLAAELAILRIAVYSNSTSPKYSGTWKFGFSVRIGCHDKKCGLDKLSPHL